MPKQKFSPQNSESPSVDFAKTDGDDNAIAPGMQAGVNFSDQFAARFELANSFNGLTFLCKLPFDKIKMAGRACISTSEFSDSRNPALVAARPRDGFPILAEIVNGFISMESRANPVTHEIVELESVRVAVTYFQRLRDGLGDMLEERLVLGSAQIDLEEFSQQCELEVPHAVAERTLKRLAADEKARRLKFEKAVAAMPAPITPSTELGTAIAQGVAAALAQMGFVKPATGKAMP